MSRNDRIDKLERALPPEEPPFRFRMCAAPKELTPEAHERYHAERGERCFTLNLGAAAIREGDDV
jgi:hypothetical protein